MRWMICLTVMFLTGCASGPADEAALCQATASARTSLAGALVSDGGAESRREGLALIEAMDSGCQP